MRIDHHTGMVLFQSGETLNYEDWERELRSALAAKQGPLRHVLADRRRLASDYHLGVREGAVDFLRTHAHELGEAQWAILVKPSSRAERNAEEASRFAESTRVRIKVFTELRPALVWLLGVYEDEELERLEHWVAKEA